MFSEIPEDGPHKDRELGEAITDMFLSLRKSKPVKVFQTIWGF